LQEELLDILEVLVDPQVAVEILQICPVHLQELISRGFLARLLVISLAADFARIISNFFHQVFDLGLKLSKVVHATALRGSWSNIEQARLDFFHLHQCGDCHNHVLRDHPIVGLLGSFTGRHALRFLLWSALGPLDIQCHRFEVALLDGLKSKVLEDVPEVE
jgi:hypothetical protein